MVVVVVVVGGCDWWLLMVWLFDLLSFLTLLFSFRT